MRLELGNVNQIRFECRAFSTESSAILLSRTLDCSKKSTRASKNSFYSLFSVFFRVYDWLNLSDKAVKMSRANSYAFISNTCFIFLFVHATVDE